MSPRAAYTISLLCLTCVLVGCGSSGSGNGNLSEPCAAQGLADSFIKRNFESRIASQERAFDAPKIEAYASHLDERFDYSPGTALEIANDLAANRAIDDRQFQKAMEATSKVTLTLHGDAKEAAREVLNTAVRIASGDTKALDGEYPDLELSNRVQVNSLIYEGQFSRAAATFFVTLASSIPDPPAPVRKRC